jgi:hypothetical protein
MPKTLGAFEMRAIVDRLHGALSGEEETDEVDVTGHVIHTMLPEGCLDTQVGSSEEPSAFE